MLDEANAAANYARLPGSLVLCCFVLFRVVFRIKKRKNGKYALRTLGRDESQDPLMGALAS